MKKILLSILIICLDFTVAYSIKTHYISLIIPPSASIGETITINGKYFGDNQDSSYVTIYGKNVLVYVSWSDTEIKVKVPPLEAVPNIKVSVTVNGIKCYEVEYFIKSEWLKKNIDVDRYNNGDVIPQVKDSVQWANLTTGAWCYYNNDTAMGHIYGKLYNWYAVTDPRGISPEGWHIPIIDEWLYFRFLYGFDSYSGGYLKETGTTHWWSPNEGASNNSGFTALPGGLRYYNGIFENQGYEGNWWSVTEGDKKSAWSKTLYCVYAGIDKGSHNKNFGFSVRCLRYK
jgi:uncharacterized protein (TIGR02145 family)